MVGLIEWSLLQESYFRIDSIDNCNRNRILVLIAQILVPYHIFMLTILISCNLVYILVFIAWILATWINSKHWSYWSLTFLAESYFNIDRNDPFNLNRIIVLIALVLISWIVSKYWSHWSLLPESYLNIDHSDLCVLVLIAIDPCNLNHIVILILKNLNHI